MAAIPGVDVVVGGHSHTLLGPDAGTMTLPAAPISKRGTTGSYPTMVADACVVTAWEYSHGAGSLDVSFDADGKVTSCNGKTIFPFDPTTFVDKTNNKAILSSADAKIVADHLEAMPQFMSVTADAAAVAALEGYRAQVGASFNKVSMTTSAHVEYPFPPPISPLPLRRSPPAPFAPPPRHRLNLPVGHRQSARRHLLRAHSGPRTLGHL